MSEEEEGGVVLTLRLEAELIHRIEEYWHRRRLRSRAEAIRELLDLGLTSPRLDDELRDGEAGR